MTRASLREYAAVQRERYQLEALYQSLNPLQLRRNLEAELAHLWTLAAPDPHRAAQDQSNGSSAPAAAAQGGYPHAPAP